ncbi:hypothetical protein JVT61DRAFT_12842 [Boletus reticuloceps]|uniref:Uncharacterized protein n=1 Tax=Boletus reticuloceps TaxID=495285 RepID=A0A8I2YXZ1_9AGAM|nr:hypothetical protein JVT61DRAFT_12842 [Boletus reticuloceps]
MPGSFGDHDSKRSVVHDDLPLSPCYISSRSADVILSDVRPTTLSADALNAINAFLDELLHTILSATRALTTTQLRASLHRVLPTTLGKEAVLEAELELRAYWERTGGIPESGSSLAAVEDSPFNLSWTFELLRLKCEAYSTLSDTDENSDAEARLFQRMNVEGIPLPKQTLLAPTSLYLTAIIEHIVSNVGRVAARDSSRAIANGQDLFIALCEDSSIYGLFKNMAVYGQIEILSKVPKSRRSMSFAPENDGASFAVRRNGSIYQSRTRLSSESVNNAPTSTTHSSRPSSRAVKMLYNKVSQDFVNGSDPGHRKVDSFASANTKQSLASRGDRSPISPTFSEDTRSQEFDDMMRSGSTMKVSLTPDRLRTMEALNREKARVNGRQKVPSATENSNGIGPSPSHPSPDQAMRTNALTTTIVSIEDDRSVQKPPPTSRPRQLSAATTSGYTTPFLTRVRASSTTTDPSATASNLFLKKHTLSESNSAVTDQRPASGPITRRKAPPHGLDINTSRPPRTRTIARSRESLNLEDVMTGSDDDGMGELKSLVSPKQLDRQRGFSTGTRELIAFLAEGPPELTASGNHLSPLSTTPKKSGRLQKMISRITLAGDTVKPPRKLTVGSGDTSSKSMTNLSPLANQPIPPRYPTSGSPSAASSEHGFTNQAATHPRQRAQSYIQKSLPSWDGRSVEGEASSPSVPSPGMEVPALRTVRSQRTLEVDFSQHAQPIGSAPLSTSFSPPAASVTILARDEATGTPSLAVQRPRSPSPPIASQSKSSKTASPLCQKVAPSPASQTPSPAASVLEHAREMRTMLEHATSAAECRILVDMFLARCKLSTDEANSYALTAPPPPRDSSADGLERTIVELFLGGGELDVHKISLDSHSAESAETPLNVTDGAPSTSSANRLADSGESR